MSNDGVVGVTGHVDNLKGWPRPHKHLSEGPAAHPRHHHVCQKQVDFPRILNTRQHRIITVRGGQNLVTGTLEGSLGNFAQPLLILDDKDGFVTRDLPPNRFELLGHGRPLELPR